MSFFISGGKFFIVFNATPNGSCRNTETLPNLFLGLPFDGHIVNNAKAIRAKFLLWARRPSDLPFVSVPVISIAGCHSK